MSLNKQLFVHLLLEEEEDDEIVQQIMRSSRNGMHKIFKARNEESCFVQLIKSHLREDVEKFREYFRLTPSQFDFILNLIEDDIKKCRLIIVAYNRNLYPITPEEKLALTLRAKILTDEEMARALSEDSDEERYEPLEMDDDFSDGDEEQIATTDHESNSEMEYESGDEIDCDVYRDFVLGGDLETIWVTSSLHKLYAKVKSINNVKIFPGPKGAARHVRNEMEAFQQLISDDMIDEIVRFTNEYIDKKKTEVNYNRERDVQLTSRKEVYALIGILYLTGMRGENRTNDGTGNQLLRACMSAKRFLFLLRCIRFDSKTTRQARQKTDKLASARTFIEALQNNFIHSYNLGEFVTLDDKLEAFRGRCGFIVYMKDKPARYGIKIYALCDAKTFYMSRFEIYCGKQPSGPYEVSNKPFDVVHRLTSHIRGSYRNLTVDNYYMSYPLIISLLGKKLTCLGTVRKNKKEIPPSFLPNKTREVRSTLFGFQDRMMMTSYVPKKNRAVVLWSSMHDEGTVDEVEGKPYIIHDYNMTKGGVDSVDQMCAKYSISRNTQRWTVALWFALLNITGINAYKIFAANRNQRRRCIFLKTLAIQLMEEHLRERANLTCLPPDISAFLKRYKVNDITKEPERLERKRKGRCVTCGRMKDNYTTVRCSKCDQFVCKKHSKQEISCEKCSQDQTYDCD